jgi:hypothetical protein
MFRGPGEEPAGVPARRGLAGAASAVFHTVAGYARLVIVGAGVIFRILFLPTRPAFVVDLKDGKAVLRRGTVHPRFLRSCEEIAADSGIPRGRIQGIRRGHGVSLGFSREIPDSAHQRLRNAWGLDA